MMKLILLALFGIAVGLYYTQIYLPDKQRDAELVEMILEIERSGVRPDKETIDMLYRYRNHIDEKYGAPYQSKEFREAYDRVIKPL